MDELIDHFLRKEYDPKYVVLDCYTDFFIAVNDMYVSSGANAVNTFMSSFCGRCKDFYKVRSILAATYTIRGDLPSRESIYFNAFDLGYTSIDEDLVDYLLEGLE